MAILLITSAFTFWVAYHYALGQKIWWIKEIGTDWGKIFTTPPSQKSGAAVTVRDVNKGWLSSLAGLHWPTAVRFPEKWSTLSAIGVSVDPISPQNPSPPNASSAFGGLPSSSTTATASPRGSISTIHPLTEQPKPQWSTAVIPGGKGLLYNNAVAMHVDRSANANNTNPDISSSNNDPGIEGSTRDPDTEALLTKERNGQTLTHKEKRHLHGYKVAEGLKNPPHKHDKEAILLKKKNGQKLTRGERGFLKKQSPQPGDTSGSAASDSDHNTVADGPTPDIPTSEPHLGDKPDLSEQRP